MFKQIYHGMSVGQLTLGRNCTWCVTTTSLMQIKNWIGRKFLPMMMMVHRFIHVCAYLWNEQKNQIYYLDSKYWQHFILFHTFCFFFRRPIVILFNSDEISFVLNLPKKNISSRIIDVKNEMLHLFEIESQLIMALIKKFVFI